MERSRTALKEFFETGEFPTESQFSDLIDSSPNFVSDHAGLLNYFHYQLVFSDLQPNAGASGTFSITSLPNGALIQNIFVKNTLEWQGGSILNVSLSLSDSNLGPLGDSYLVSADPSVNLGVWTVQSVYNGTPTFDITASNQSRDITATIAVTVSGGGGGVINQLDQGFTDISIWYLDPGL